MEYENQPQNQTEAEKELMEVTQEKTADGIESQTEDVPRETEQNIPKLPTWDELPEWAKRLVPGELIHFKGSFFKFIGMTPDLAVVLKYEGPTGKSKE